MDFDELFKNGKPNLMHCPFCGKFVDVHGGNEEWKPTFCDPDSGGSPYYVHCECGLEYSIGYCEIDEFIKAWNSRSELVSCEECLHLGENVNICLGCNNRSNFTNNLN